MSLKIIKRGVLDTIQDTGRYGYQSSGINPGGAIDRFSAQLSNCLLDKNKDAPVIEMHFPAPVILFEKSAVICLAGADFCPVIDNHQIPSHQPIAVNGGAVLNFTKLKKGARCYLSVLQDLSLSKWLNSYSTNLKAEAGGYEGRCLQNGDVLYYPVKKNIDEFLGEELCKVLPYKAEPESIIATDIIEVIQGNEWHWLADESQQLFHHHSFIITTNADRMGYHLKGKKLLIKEQHQLVSSGVSFGTLQLLPNGQFILLMADHQTTGGYPRIAHVISAHLPQLAQMKPGDNITFKLTDLKTAEAKLVTQNQYLISIQYAAAFAIEKLLL